MQSENQRLAEMRTALANERTLAAWVRTGLAVVVGGVVAHQWVELDLALVGLVLGNGLVGLAGYRFLETRKMINSG